MILEIFVANFFFDKFLLFKFYFKKSKQSAYLLLIISNWSSILIPFKDNLLFYLTYF